ncbi:MAG: hypothetical protein MZV64_09990 [Ignavibacteriales bacterium]|nr:hypothetical protein [Ignavibacteriales bacterium]
MLHLHPVDAEFRQLLAQPVAETGTQISASPVIVKQHQANRLAVRRQAAQETLDRTLIRAGLVGSGRVETQRLQIGIANEGNDEPSFGACHGRPSGEELRGDTVFGQIQIAGLGRRRQGRRGLRRCTLDDTFQQQPQQQTLGGGKATQSVQDVARADRVLFTGVPGGIETELTLLARVFKSALDQFRIGVRQVRNAVTCFIHVYQALSGLDHPVEVSGA